MQANKLTGCLTIYKGWVRGACILELGLKVTGEKTKAMEESNRSMMNEVRGCIMQAGNKMKILTEEK